MTTEDKIEANAQIEEAVRDLEQRGWQREQIITTDHVSARQVEITLVWKGLDHRKGVL